MNIKLNKKCHPQILLVFIMVLILFLGQLPTISATILKGEIETIVEAEELFFPSEIIYTVKPGDSVARIASQHKINRWQLREWNNLDSNNIIKPGQKLIIKHVSYPPVEGLASWYGPGFHGRNMANGQVYNMYDIIVAHRTLPLGTKVRVTNLENGKSIVAPVLDRGPYVKNGRDEYTREIDLSFGVAIKLGTIRRGVVLARVEPIEEPLPLDQ